MLENRSFDNLLGSLYAPSDLPTGKSFEGLIGKNLSNPIPAGAPAPPGVTSIPILNATDYHDPYPDPGEVYANVNTQLFNTVSSPYNLPRPLPATAPMTGFVNDYIQSCPTGLGDPPTYDQYSTIVACYPAADRADPVDAGAPVRSVRTAGSARCPSQTWCNRAFGAPPPPGATWSMAAATTRGGLEWLDDGIEQTSCSTTSRMPGSSG